MNATQPSPTPYQPPAGFVPVASALPGITVFAPPPEKTTVDAPQSFTCPQCGAPTRYDVAAGGVACEHCGYTAPAKAQVVGQRAARSEFTLETLGQAERGWGVTRQMLHCDSCGAELTLAEGAITATCPFCASNNVNVRAAAADVLRPRFLIPFKVEPRTTEASVRAWLARGWFHPSGLAGAAALDNFTGTYLPYWTFAANIRAAWEAEVGYERQERYYDAGSKEWKTRTVIDWRWERGEVTLGIDDLLVAGTTHASRVLLGRLQPFELHALVAYTPDFLAGWQAQAYDVPLTTAWEAGKAVMRERAKDSCYADIHRRSHHVRNFGMTADFADETWRYILVPVYVAAYRYQEKTYQVLVNGQTGAVAGQKPSPGGRSGSWSPRCSCRAWRSGSSDLCRRRRRAARPGHW